MKSLRFFLIFVLSFAIAATAFHAIDSDKGAVTKRDDFIGVQCKSSKEIKTVGCSNIQEGISFLNKRGDVRIAARSRNRVSCSWNTGIYYENNEDFDVTIPGPDIANAVLQLFKECKIDCRKGKAFCGMSIFTKHRILVTRTDVFGESC